ncbi:MAG TPA: alanine--tRNA ligase [Candidatus Omnitrophota bacterium]|nr:alanine--tRNA ligase [Candidatus Omnitrophota bacterium]
MTADILREKFLNFFKTRGHKIVESDSLVPKDDPTVLFTPAGMNQFKKEFLGFDSGFKRAATSQRCLRTDDLDKVGKTSAHHTFFEMLGNFSFGDYFKPEAIAWAWEFLTKELKIDQHRLWVSVYQDDDEAYNTWKDKIGIPEKKIVRLGDKDNFWPAEAKTKGPNGPCGPCSEIFYDFGPSTGCGEKICDPSCSCGRFVEIWNLVFTQFNRKEDGSLEPLPNKNIDTGMGLERLTAVMQGKQNNFETELFQPIIKEIQRSAETKPQEEKKLLYAIADHLRSAVFSIFDGIIPLNEGRGYVVRKIIRKSLLALRQLGIEKPFLYKLVPVLAEVMKKPYPELKDKQEDISQLILNEEENFIRTLNSSNDLFKDKFGGSGRKLNPEEAGKIAFQLYDTYGIPLDLTKTWLSQQGVQLSQSAFDQELLEQMTRSRLQSSMKGDVFDAKGLELKLKCTIFLGYNYKDSLIEAKIIEIIDPQHRNKTLTQATSGVKAAIILDETPFYAESGGQVGDTGKLINETNVFEVINTQKIDNVFLHIGTVISGSFQKGSQVIAQIDADRRLNIARNHTATHLLQAALRQVLGKHVGQQGSLVNAEKLRFDFTHFKGLSAEEIAKVEEIANSYVKNGYAVDSKEMELKEAKKSGALAFFEEKYGENVRVVSIGGVSKELCGGTHLTNIKQIGLIKIISESSVASGIRRIEAVTDKLAEQFVKDQQQKAMEEAAKSSKLKELKEQEKKHNEQINKMLPARAIELFDKIETINGINAVFSIENNLEMGSLRLLADIVKGKLNHALIVLGSQVDGKASLIIGLTQDLTAKGLSAKDIILQVAPLIGGSGGGRQDFAQAGGMQPENFALAFEKLRGIIKNSI